MPWQPSKQKAAEGVPTIDAPNKKDSWAKDRKMERAEYSPIKHPDAKRGIKEHSLENITKSDIEGLIEPSTRNNSASEPEEFKNF